MRPQLLPTECEVCDCLLFTSNGASCMMRGDPPSTCQCGHFAFRHKFKYRDPYERLST